MRRVSRSRWRSLTLAATCLMVFGSDLPARGADWPQWLGPSRNGVSVEPVEPWTEAPAVLWRQPVGNGFSVPVIADGVVYVHAAVPEKNAERITAFDLASGEEKWSHSYDRAPYNSVLGVGPRATPSVAAKRLVALGITGELACFDAASGEPLWRVNPYREHSVATPNFGVCSSPLIVGDRILLPVGGSSIAIAAYDLATGKLAWKALDEPASSASPILWERGVGEERTVDVVVQTTLRIVGIDPENGRVRWEHPLVFQPSGVSPTPLISGQRLVCTTQDTGTLAIEVASGSKVGDVKLAWWQNEMASYFSTGTIGADGRVLLVTNAVMPLPRADVRCVDPETGREFWAKQGLGYFHVGLIATGNDRLLLLDDAGKLTLAKAGRDGYQELCQAKVCGGTFCAPVLSNGRLIVRDGQEIVCLQLKAND